MTINLFNNERKIIVNMNYNKDIKILIITSKSFNNEYKLKTTMYALNKFKNRIVISTLGKDENYINEFIYKSSLLFDYRYKEFPHYHKQYNIDCVMPRWKYNKVFNAKNINIRNRDAIKWADKVFIFVHEYDMNNTELRSIINFAKKEGKLNIFSND